MIKMENAELLETITSFSDLTLGSLDLMDVISNVDYKLRHYLDKSGLNQV